MPLEVSVVPLSMRAAAVDEEKVAKAADKTTRVLREKKRVESILMLVDECRA
jgi:hypothetical protein